VVFRAPVLGHGADFNGNATRDSGSELANTRRRPLHVKARVRIKDVDGAAQREVRASQAGRRGNKMTNIDTADKSWAMHVLHGAEYAALRRELQRETTHTFKERFLIILHKWLYSLRQKPTRKEHF
jgi:hypothetical protein